LTSMAARPKLDGMQEKREPTCTWRLPEDVGRYVRWGERDELARFRLANRIRVAAFRYGRLTDRRYSVTTTPAGVTCRRVR